MAPVTSAVTPPDAFARALAGAWIAGDRVTLETLIAPEAEMLSLTGLWCEGRPAILAAMEDERAGTLARARLVSGRATCRAPAPGLNLISQRLVVSGLCDAEGREMPRLGAVLSATLVATPAGWQAVALTFAPVAA